MSAPPSDLVFDTFGVELEAPLGGRLNQHWLVTSGVARLVLRRWGCSAEEIDYEQRLLASVAALGWPVAPALEGPVELDNPRWSLFPFLPGEPPSATDPLAEQRCRGQLLAEFHLSVAGMDGFRQRTNWRRCEEVLGDLALDRVRTEHEPERPEEVRIVRWHLDRARQRTAGLPLTERPGIVVHGDFAPWNLRFQDGRLSGILDFELAHWDHRIGLFSLSWRGKYDEVIHGYADVTPLEPEEWELLTPLWWSLLIDGACRLMQQGQRDDGWIVRKLLQRSPLMGPDANEFR